ncbi:ABC transporter ATP-binding protein [Candidatus Neomarinimicrobiota bacterium]
MSNFRRFIAYLGNYWQLIVLSLLLSLLYVGLNSLSLWMIASLVNTVLVSPDQIPVDKVDPSLATSVHGYLKAITSNLIQRSNPLDTLARLCWILLSIFAFKNIVLYLKNLTSGIVENRLIRDLRNDLFYHLQSLSIPFYTKKHSGEISSILINDVTYVRAAFNVSVQRIIVEPLNLLVSLAIMFIISWQLSLMAVLLVPLAALFANKLGKIIRRRSKRTTEQIAGVMTVLQENLRSIRIVKAFVREVEEMRRFKDENEKYYHFVFKRFSIKNLSAPVSELIGVAGGVIILWVGGQQVLLGAGRGVNAEEFMTYIIFLFAMVQPLRILSGVSANLQVGMASADRIFNVLDEIPTVVNKPDGVRIDDFTKEIRFENVSFQYEDSDMAALDHISTTIGRGEVVALVGSSGAGKSTFADLIPRFFDSTDGRIFLDGHDLRDIDIDSLRRLIGIVPQETVMFHATIRENIIYGKSTATEAEVEAAARAAHTWDFIQETPHGLDTMIGERGAKLSGGQRQRLAIARALLKNPSILILDEATSALDTESEKRVQEAIDSLVRNHTVIVIAHRLSTVQIADKILVLEKGRLLETGTHAELLEQKGKYWQLTNSQSVSQSPAIE